MEEKKQKQELMPDIEGYVKLEHKVNDDHMVMYVKNTMHPFHAFQGSFDYAQYFKDMHHKELKKRKEAEKKVEEEKQDKSE